MKSARFLPLLSVVILACASWTNAAADKQPEPPKPASHTDRRIAGWTVRLDDRLLTAPHAAAGEQALRFLEARLTDITYVVDQGRLAKLRKVVIVLDLTHGRLRSMQYHPSRAWLQENGYSPDLAKCVHIPEVAGLVTRRNIAEQPWCVLHELAHAYHDQVLGFDEPRIREAYERYKKSGHGDKALLYDGSRVRHYGLTDQKEFFAEMTEAYFGVNDFFPFNRAELMTAEPEVFRLLQILWDSAEPERGTAGVSKSASVAGFRARNGFEAGIERGDVTLAGAVIRKDANGGSFKRTYE